MPELGGDVRDVRSEGLRAEPCEAYPWDGVADLGLLSELQTSVVVGVY